MAFHLTMRRSRSFKHSHEPKAGHAARLKTRNKLQFLK